VGRGVYDGAGLVMSSEQRGDVRLSWYVGGGGYFEMNVGDLRRPIVIFS
jgi:hypothetical protein